ncbi:MAG TPA: isopentenyl phosphate kinase [Methanothrix sp.]|nr:isopentenyl phosphate kinase [Methanothrix sp.]HPT19617.1 isopentenyl phosphate kinase [Methanothrix sp.]
MTRILKIGGSIITDKSRDLAARPDEIRRAAEEIASCPQDLVLVHGAGSFGHIPARRFGLPDQFSSQGLMETHGSVVMLNQMVVEALGDAGVSCLPVHPLSCLTLRNWRIDGFHIGPIKEMLHNGIMPVLHGDVAMDVSRRAGIVSGDQLVSYLGRALSAHVVAVGCNVEGVLVGGRTIPVVNRADLSAIEGDLGGSAGVDVTGGMKGKLLELLELADSGISSVIFDAGKEGSIRRALLGEKVGTLVEGSA